MPIKCRVSLLCIDDLLLIDNSCDDGDDLGDDRRSETNWRLSRHFLKGGIKGF